MFVMFAGMISIDYAEFNVLYFIPIIYLSYVVFNCCLLNKLEHSMTDKIPILDSYNYMSSFFDHSFQNPLNPHGMLVIGFIIGAYTIAYKKSLITHS
jgi:hypothetical protein